MKNVSGSIEVSFNSLVEVELDVTIFSADVTNRERTWVWLYDFRPLQVRQIALMENFNVLPESVRIGLVLLVPYLQLHEFEPKAREV